MLTMKPPGYWMACGHLALSMALVGTYVGLSPLLVAAIPVLLLAWLRFAVAAVAMAGWVRRGPTEPRLTRHDHALLFLQSLLGNVLFTLCALAGTAQVGALAAGVTMAGIPAVVALLSALFLGERLNLRLGLAIVCSATAVTLLALARQAPGELSAHEAVVLGALAQSAGAQAAVAEAAAPHWSGYALLIAAVLCEASYVVIGKRLSGHLGPRRVTSLINLWGLALSTPLALPLLLQFDPAAVSLPLWALFLFYALSASVVTVWLWMRGLQRVRAQQAGIFTVMLPLASAAVGVLVLGEPHGVAHAAALVLAVVAVVLATRGSQVPRLDT